MNRAGPGRVEPLVHRSLLFLSLLAASAALAEPLHVSVNLTTGGRWLEGMKVWAGKNAVQLEGDELTMGGTLDLTKRLGLLRLGGQVSADVMLFPRDLGVVRSGPLATSAISSDESVSSLLFVSAAPFVGLGGGRAGELQGWVDLLVSLELATARVERERHFALTPVPTLRVGGSVPIGDAGLELSLLASYFGAPRLALAMGVHF